MIATPSVLVTYIGLGACLELGDAASLGQVTVFSSGHWDERNWGCHGRVLLVLQHCYIYRGYTVLFSTC